MAVVVVVVEVIMEGLRIIELFGLFPLSFICHVAAVVLVVVVMLVVVVRLVVVAIVVVKW